MKNHTDKLLGYTANIRLGLEYLTRAAMLAYLSHSITFPIQAIADGRLYGQAVSLYRKY